MEQRAPEDIVAEVQKVIDSHPDYRGLFQAIQAGAHEDRGFWFVPVTLESVQPNSRRMEIYSRFAELEAFLQREKNLSVLLLPVLSKQIA